MGVVSFRIHCFARLGCCAIILLLFTLCNNLLFIEYAVPICISHGAVINHRAKTRAPRRASQCTVPYRAPPVRAASVH